MASIFLLTLLSINLLFITQIQQISSYTLTHSNDNPSIYRLRSIAFNNDDPQLNRQYHHRMSRSWFNWSPKEFHISGGELFFVWLDKRVVRTVHISKRKMKITIVLGIGLAIFLVLTIVFASLYGVEKNRKTESTVINNNDELCLTPYCIKAANLLLESIDENVDPCENFFEFSCGKWLKTQRIPDDAGSQDTFNVLRTELDKNIVDILSSPLPIDLNNIQSIVNARYLFDSCINETSIESSSVETMLLIINDELGGWPILQGSNWNASSFNFSRLLLKLREYNHNVILNFATAIDDRNSSNYFIRISQSDLVLEQRTNYNDSSRLTMAYRKFLYDLAASLTNDTSMIQTDVEEIYQFEKRIAMFHWTPAEQRARQNETIRTTLDNLPPIFNPQFQFDLFVYLREIYSQANIILRGNDTVSISELTFLRNASTIVNETSMRSIQNYFVWRFVLDRVGNLPRKYRLLREIFDQIFRGTTAERSRTTICANMVNANMGFAVSKVYLRQYFDENARTESLEMITNIRNAFIDMLRNSTWMDDVSRERAVEKALAIDEKIGYPEYLADANTTELERMYREYVFGPSYIENILKLLQIRSQENLRMLRENVDRKGWGSSPPTIVNAFYNPPRNQISFPAGILQMPFFNKDAPKFLNYGGIGAVIGHEITHGFDDTGRQYDKDGNRIPWWTSETIDKFNDRKTCIVNQYSNYILTQINLPLNGNQTQGENIADNGGIKGAFYAYQKWSASNSHLDRKLPGLNHFSSEQMFFINYGQIWCSKMTDANALNRILTGVHSPGRFRVIGPTSNFEEFDRVFSCRPGQNNSRVDKCIVW